MFGTAQEMIDEELDLRRSYIKDEIKTKIDRLLVIETAYCYNTNYDDERQGLKRDIKVLKNKL